MKGFEEYRSKANSDFFDAVKELQKQGMTDSEAVTFTARKWVVDAMASIQMLADAIEEMHGAEKK